MSIHYQSLLLAGGAIALVELGVLTPAAHAQEFPDSTAYYEEDGLLDITEWFDGNDYNPTDEVWWRWDDETYQAAKDTGSDIDNDWYGYTERGDNDWYYDYYDPYPYSYHYDNSTPDLFTFGSRFYDYDNDGAYDAVVSYSDRDRDGYYEDYDYYFFTDTAPDKQKKQVKDRNARGESRQQAVTGRIDKTKVVKVRGGMEHVVVAIKPDTQKEGQKAELLIVDLGKADDLKNQPKVGDTITAKGPKAIIGKQGVVLAKSFEMNGKTMQVNRNPRDITGKVVSTHKTKVRGTEHLMAMVETNQKGKMRKIAVDLGPADRLKMDIKENSNLTFSGFPVKLMVKGKAKPVIIAQSVTRDDKIVQINRQPGEAHLVRDKESEK